MDVSKSRVFRMVYNGNPYFLIDDLGVPLFLETPKWSDPLWLEECYFSDELARSVDLWFATGKVSDT